MPERPERAHRRRELLPPGIDQHHRQDGERRSVEHDLPAETATRFNCQIEQQNARIDPLRTVVAQLWDQVGRRDFNIAGDENSVTPSNKVWQSLAIQFRELGTPAMSLLIG